MDSKKGSLLFVTALIALLEVYFSSISLLSRGFILNGGSVLLVLLQLYFGSQTISKKQVLLIFISFAVLMVTSIKLVSDARDLIFQLKPVTPATSEGSQEISKRNLREVMVSLLIDRWVGLEGTMSAVGYQGNREAIFKEIYSENMSTGTSLYDREVAKSIYTVTATENSQFVSLPGFIGWISLLDNSSLILFSALALGVFCNLIEFFIMNLNGNVFMTALFGQVLAYRVSHFGYLPHQSYKLLAGIFLVAVGIFFAQIIMEQIYGRFTNETGEVA